MGKVAKYNLFKGLSTMCTFGTPIITLLCSGEFFVHNSDTAMSAAAVFVLLIVALLFKDKILEHWKTPPVFVVCFIVFLLICIIDSILVPIKNVCLATMISTGVDEFTFKNIYKSTELMFPNELNAYKHIGFLFTTSKKLEEFKQ